MSVAEKAFSLKACSVMGGLVKKPEPVKIRLFRLIDHSFPILRTTESVVY